MVFNLTVDIGKTVAVTVTDIGISSVGISYSEKEVVDSEHLGFIVIILFSEFVGFHKSADIFGKKNASFKKVY